MRLSGLLFRTFLIGTFACAAALFASSSARAQAKSPYTLNFKVSSSDFATTFGATTVYRHALPANTSAGRALRAKEMTNGLSGTPGHSGLNGLGSGSSQANITYPDDLGYLGGPVVPYADFHAIYLLPNGSCPIATCWGNPEGFLSDLGRSNFIHLADQYIGLSGGQRYRNGFDVNVTYPPPSTPLTDADIEYVVYVVASITQKTGYGNIYHVFLPPGQDECFNATFTVCYSPDKPATFYYCGYHSSLDVPGLGHLVYTVEPFNDVAGCDVQPGTPNGQVADSQDNVLSHETFETITDPDGTAWWNFSAVPLFGAEIGDECEFVTFVGPKGIPYFNPPTFKVGSRKYAVQSEYSNQVHACDTTP